MARALLLSLVSCLAAVSQASLIRRCDLAKVLHEEDLDGFEGYSLSDCECPSSATTPISPPLLVAPSAAIFLSLSFIVQKAALCKKPSQYSIFIQQLLTEPLLCTRDDFLR